MERDKFETLMTDFGKSCSTALYLDSQMGYFCMRDWKSESWGARGISETF